MVGKLLALLGQFVICSCMSWCQIESSGKTTKKATVLSIGFIPISATADENDKIVYDIERIGNEQYELRFSPIAFWAYINE